MKDDRVLLSATLLIGIGMGGFIDGILFHQLLQIHNMMSAKFPPRESIQNMEINMFWDGLFHLLTWLSTAAGIALLWKAGKHRSTIWSTRQFIGGLFLGWGIFNLVEGILNHHILHIHHVYEYPHTPIFDYAFLASGVILIIMGIIMIRRQSKDAPRTISA